MWPGATTRVVAFPRPICQVVDVEKLKMYDWMVGSRRGLYSRYSYIGMPTCAWTGRTICTHSSIKYSKFYCHAYMCMRTTCRALRLMFDEQILVEYLIPYQLVLFVHKSD